MKRWKVVINYIGKIIEVIIEAKSSFEASLSTEKIYAGCTVKNIYEINS
jgi:hypothetical protein